LQEGEHKKIPNNTQLTVCLPMRFGFWFSISMFNSRWQWLTKKG